MKQLLPDFSEFPRDCKLCQLATCRPVHSIVLSLDRVKAKERREATERKPTPSSGAQARAAAAKAS